jgi:DNA-binding response OmpR family regulator
MVEEIGMPEDTIKILVIEDDSVDRQMLRRTLAATDMSVSIEEVGTVVDAIKALRDNRYDVALLDYKLPDGTAISVLKKMQEPSSAFTPIIVLTVHADKKIALEALKEGAQDFLPKESVNPDNLERAIRYCMQRNKLWQELQWSKERERRERELRAFHESVTELDTAPPPAVKESEFVFEQFVVEYQFALTKSLEEITFKGPQEVPDQMRVLANKLGELQAGPKDIIDIHTLALTRVCNGKAKSVEQAFTDEARIMVVQLMGYMCRYYRNRLLNAVQESLRPKKKQG